jgi:hypothetical protein
MPAIDIQGPAGRLEALLEAGASPCFAALVCHPHPLHGGTLHNHATHRLARAARAAGGASLRFGFRGVGRSAGRHDGGRGEVEDALAALDFLAARFPGLPCLACGFSFGAHVALAAAPRHPGVTGLLLAGLVVRPRPDVPRDLGPLLAWPGRAAVLQAEHDELSSPDEVRAALAPSAGSRLLVAVEGAPHLFTGRLDELQREAEEAFDWLLGP